MKVSCTRNGRRECRDCMMTFRRRNGIIELDVRGLPNDMMTNDLESLKGREFVHFKGKRYQFLDVAKHSETQELMVVYRTLYGDMSHWVRPASMFFEEIERDGYKGPRFRLGE